MEKFRYFQPAVRTVFPYGKARGGRTRKTGGTARPAAGRGNRACRGVFTAEERKTRAAANARTARTNLPAASAGGKAQRSCRPAGRAGMEKPPNGALSRGGRRFFPIVRNSGRKLSLRELRRAASLLQAVFLSFLAPRVAREESLFFQRGAKIGCACTSARRCRGG